MLEDVLTQKTNMLMTMSMDEVDGQYKAYLIAMCMYISGGSWAKFRGQGLVGQTKQFWAGFKWKNGTSTKGYTHVLLWVEEDTSLVGPRDAPPLMQALA